MIANGHDSSEVSGPTEFSIHKTGVIVANNLISPYWSFILTVPTIHPHMIDQSLITDTLADPVSSSKGSIKNLNMSNPYSLLDDPSSASP